MGQKKVVKKTEEELIKENEQRETIAVKMSKVSDKQPGKRIDIGRIYINASYNNTILTATDSHGNVLLWISAGSLGFSGPKKATPFASSKMVAAVADKLKKIGLTNIEIIVKGVGRGRDAAIKSLANQGFNILLIRDNTPIPHNGPQPPKARRT